MTTPVVNFRDFDVRQLFVPEKPDQTATRFPDTKKTGLKADEIIFRYDHVITTEDGKTIVNRGPLRMKFPRLTSNRGVVYKDFSGGTKAPNPSIFVKFDVRNNADHRLLVGHPSTQYRPSEVDADGNDVPAEGVFGTIYDWSCEQTYNYKKYQLRGGNSKFSRDSVPDLLPEKLIVLRPLYTDKDGRPELVGQEKPDADPGKFFKITTFNAPGTPEYREAPWSTPSGKIIKLRDLMEKYVEFEPIVLFRHIWYGEKYSITSEITESLIVEIRRSTGLNPRLDVLRTAWLKQNPDYDGKVEAAFEKLRATEGPDDAPLKVRQITLDPDVAGDADPDQPDDAAGYVDPAPSQKKSSILLKLQGVSGKSG